MKNSIYIPIVSLFIALLCMGTQCRKQEIEYKYNFLEKINLYPVQKVYQIGDTIWLQYTNTNKQLYDVHTSNYILSDTVSVDFQISLNSRYNTPLNPSDGFCDFLTVNGLNLGRYLNVYGSGFLNSFGCNNTYNYNFTVGVVLKQKGIYSLDLLGSPRNVIACPNRISSFPLSTIEYRFDVIDCNKDIFLSIPPISRIESTKEGTENKIDNKQVFIVNVE